MIFGVGTDIVKVSRLEKWVKEPELLKRFFNTEEIFQKGSLQSLSEHYAARFAAKEAFSKALGTGLIFDLKEVYVQNNEEGKPSLFLEGKAEKLLFERCGKCKIHLSLSHEKEYALAFLVIEKI